jgi:trimeric autotransporter adhesin
MSIKYYANRVQETSISTGAGNFVLGGAPLGFRPFSSSIGSNNTFNYYIYRQDTNFEWEIGVGSITSSGGINLLVRQRVITSSNGNSFVGFTSGTKFVETIISEDRVNTSFINVEEKSSNFSPAYIPTTYVIDASLGNVQVSLPSVTTQSDPIVLGFVLNATTGNAYEQINAIRLIPDGIETIGGVSEIDVSILNDYLQIVSVPSQDAWVLLDPIQDSTNPYGIDGTIQFKSNTAFSGVNEFVWDSSNKLLIGNSGVNNADIVLPSSSGQTTIFNQNLRDNDLRVAGSGNTHLLFVDGGLNRVGINSSVVPDTLSINAGSGGGLTISKSGVGPRILLSNTSVSGITSNNVVGSIVFSGLNSLGNLVEYGSIKSIIENNADNSEDSSLKIETVNNGSVEEIAVFSPSGITLGSNSQNFDGILLGTGSDNEGNNIVAGYFNSVCGENCVVLGNNATVSSGTFGGTIGSEHSISGVNLWILGGSGVTASGSNKTILALNQENYLEIQNSGYIKYVTLTDKSSTFAIDNISVLTSGVDQNLAFTFLNSSGVSRTGLTITSSLSNVTNNSEESSFVVKVLSSGSPTDLLSLEPSKVMVGKNSVSGNNIVFGIDNKVSHINNIIFGKDISVTGSNNTIIGNNISLSSSGTGITIVGKDNTCVSGVNLGVVIVGNGNESSEDYSVAVGVDNANSGLYTVSCGYLNGVHGDYSVGVGEGNTVLSNYSVAIGRNNNLSATNLNGSSFAMGIGNLGVVSNTGVVVGYLNTIYGSGGTILGTSCSSSGSNNFIVGDSLASTGLGNVLVGLASLSSGLNNLVVGKNLSINGTNNSAVGNNSSISGINNFSLGNNNVLTGSGNTIIGNNRSVSGTGIIDIFASPTNGISCTPTGVYIYTDTGWIFETDVVVTGTGTFGSGIVCSGSASFGSNVTVVGNLTSSGLAILTSGVNTLGNVTASGTGIFNSGISTLGSVIASGTGIFNSRISTLGNVASSGTGIFSSGISTLGNVASSGTGIFSSGISTLGSVIASGTGIFNSGISTLGNISCSGTGVLSSLSLSALSVATGTSAVSSMVLQNNQVRTVPTAFSGVITSPFQVLETTPENLFLYQGNGIFNLFLPNGTGLYLGKKYLIVNMSNGSYSSSVAVHKSGAASAFISVYGGQSTHLIHAGNDNWVRINGDGSGYGTAQN